MKRIYTFGIMAILILLCLNLFSQRTLTGVVVNSETGSPIEGVYVYTANKEFSASTNENGYFNLHNYSGNDSLFFTHISFQKIAILPKGNSVKIMLPPSSIHLSDAVVTGTKSQISFENTPLSISVINSIEIEESGASAILPIISEKVPGVFVSERGITGFGVASGSAGKISIRGMGGNPNTQVLMLIDGHPQYMGIMGHPIPDAYVASDAHKVEIIRGPASIMYGSGAMGGVINIITKKQEHDGYTINVGNSYGSFNTRKHQASLGCKKKKLSAFASFNHDYTNGHRDNSGFSIYNGYGKLSYLINNNIELFADFSFAKFKTYDPGPINTVDTTYLNNVHWIDILRGKVSFSITNTYEKSSGALKFFHNFGEHNIYDGFHSKDINSGAMLYQSFNLLENNLFTIGIDHKVFGGIAENILAMQGEGIIFCDTTQTETGVYAITQQKIFDKLVLNAGIRLEQHSSFGKETLPQLGFTYNLFKNTDVRALFSKGYRSPTIRELFLWAPANAELEPERLTNYEIGINQKIGGALNFNITAFYIEAHNLINTLFIAGKPMHINTGKLFNKGIEFALNYRLTKNLRFNTNYSYIKTNKLVLANPEHQTYFGISYKYNKFRFVLNNQYIANLYTNLSMNNQEKQSYFIVNTRISYDLNNTFSFFIAGNNLLNEEYEINYLYPMPGINFMGGVFFKIIKYD